MQLISTHSINSRQQYFSRLCWIIFQLEGYVCTCPFLCQVILPLTVFQVKKKLTTITKRWHIRFEILQKSFKFHSLLTIITVLLLGRMAWFFWRSSLRLWKPMGKKYWGSLRLYMSPQLAPLFDFCFDYFNSLCLQALWILEVYLMSALPFFYLLYIRNVKSQRQDLKLESERILWLPVSFK